MAYTPRGRGGGDRGGRGGGRGTPRGGGRGGSRGKSPFYHSRFMESSSLAYALRFVFASPESSLISQYAGGFGDRGGRGGARGRGAPRGRGRGAPRGGGGARGGAKTIVVCIPNPHLVTSSPWESFT